MKWDRHLAVRPPGALSLLFACLRQDIWSSEYRYITFVMKDIE